MRRWLVGLWTLLCIAVIVAGALLLISGRRASNDAGNARVQAQSVDATRRGLDVQTVALNRQAADASAEVARLNAGATPLEQATARVITAFDAYEARVAATSTAQTARIVTLNRAVAAANAHDRTQLQSILDTDVPKSTAALVAALAAEQDARASVDAALQAFAAARG